MGLYQVIEKKTGVSQGPPLGGNMEGVAGVSCVAGMWLSFIINDSCRQVLHSWQAAHRRVGLGGLYLLPVSGAQGWPWGEARGVLSQEH